MKHEGLAKGARLWHHRGMPKKTKKNPTDVNLLARSVVEAAIGESLNPPLKSVFVIKRQSKIFKRPAKVRH